MKPNKINIIGICSMIIAIVALIIFCARLSTKYEQAKYTISVKTGENSILNENVDVLISERKEITRLKDSASKVGKDLEAKNKKLETDYNSIQKAYNQERENVSKLSNSESVDLFKKFTGVDFPTIKIDSTKVVNYKVPIPAIRNANDGFVMLKKVTADNSNLTARIDGYEGRVSNFLFLISEYEQAQEKSDKIIETKNRIHSNDSTVIKNDAVMLRKETRAKNINKWAFRGSIAIYIVIKLVTILK